MSAGSTLEILVVDDRADGARAMTASLEASGAAVAVTVARRLDETLPAIASRRFDALLLALNLPDSSGLETVVEVCGRAPDLPVVVVTRASDTDLSARSLRAGAEDYVPNDLDPAVLLRTVTHAIERHRRVVDEIDHARTSPRVTTLPAQPRGPLSERDPELFDALVTRYGDALEVALDRAAYRSRAKARDVLIPLAARLGGASATPRDVVDIHMQALPDTQRAHPPERATAYADEGRFALVELLGRLASYYRDRYLATSLPSTGERG